jgi:hypothetical protein
VFRFLEVSMCTAEKRIFGRRRSAADTLNLTNW